MKFIKHCVTVIITVTFTTTINAQSAEHFKDHNGYKASIENGVLSSLARWNTFGAQQQNNPVTDPLLKMQQQLGIAPSPQYSTLANNYEFYGGGMYKGNNVPYSAITDSEGNTYITGASTNVTQPCGDFFTMKVSASGETLWQKREAAAIYAVEYGMHLSFDGAGNIIAVGLKWNGNDMDIRVIKYSPAGDKLWESVFENSTQGLEIPAALTVGNDGNIYITGITWSGSSIDYLTLKYTTDGSLVWSRTENPDGGESWNEATAIALDVNGNVIVTGYSPNPDGWLNYHTVKYNAEGTKLWEQGYNYESTDPDNIADVTNSIARAVTTDADGNIYVTGTFDTFLGRIGTIKYDANGQQQWTATHKSGSDVTMGWKIAVQENTIYVAGSHVGSFADDGTVLISYTPGGTENWVEESTDLIEAANTTLSFDADGNIVTAANGMTPGAEEWTQDVAARAHKYSQQGTELGQAAFVISTATGTATMGDMAGAGLDDEGNLYFTVNSFYSEDGAVIETVKTAFGATVAEPEWNEVYTNLGSAAATMLNSFPDSNGNTFSTGNYYNFEDGALHSNYFIVKHNAVGAIAWNAVYNSENGNAAEGIIGRADAQGNSYVCLLPGFDQSPVLKVKKLSPEGAELWSAEIELNNPQVYVLEVQADGSIYLGGTAFETENSEHASFVGIKLKSDGSQAWKTFMQGTNAQNNIYQINAGKVDADGRLILTGTHGSGNFISQDAHLTAIQFNADGSAGWVTPVTVSGQSSSGTDLYISNDGSIYINGFAQDNATYYEDIVTTKLSSTGEILWMHTFGESSRNERSYTLKPFSNGAVAVVGYSLAENGDIHNALIKYSPEGEEIWNFASENMRYYNDLHIDGSDVCYIMDQVLIDPFPHKIFNTPFPIASLITVDANGENAEEEFFVGPEYAEFYGEKLVPHTDNRLLLAGSVGNEAFYQGTYFFETQHDGTLGIPNNPALPTAKNVLGQNYPNPVQDVTTIPFYLTQGGKAVIKLYNLEGRLIKDLANDTFAPGAGTVQVNTKGIAPGIYLYQIECGRFKQARKMVIR